MNSSGTAGPGCIDEMRFQNLCFMVDFILVGDTAMFCKSIKIYKCNMYILHEHHGKLEAMLGAGAAVP